MVFSDLPPQQQSRVVCAVSAAVRYEIPANIVLAVAEQEGGHPGQWVANTNGTYDVGSMQFNTAYLRGLAHYGITPKDVAAAGCYSFDLAAWRLRQHLLHDKGDMWTRVADYHSRTPSINATYRYKIMVRAARWATWLDAHFVTYDVTPGRRHTLHSPKVAIADDAAVASVWMPPQSPARAPVQRTVPVAPYVPRGIVVLDDHNDQ